MQARTSQRSTAPIRARSRRCAALVAVGLLAACGGGAPPASEGSRREAPASTESRSAGEAAPARSADAEPVTRAASEGADPVDQAPPPQPPPPEPVRPSEAMTRLVASLRPCIARSLQRNPTPPTGNLRAVPRVSADGTVRFRLVGQSSDATLRACLGRVLANVRLERDARPAHVQYPTLFGADQAPTPLVLLEE